MPPATTMLAEPALTRSWASMIAFMPEPQTLLMVVQPVDFGRPAASEAWRAGAWPRLAGSTQPMITSETSATGTPACSTAALIAVAPRVVVGTPVNWPRKEPMAVRLAPTMTMPDMMSLREWLIRRCWTSKVSTRLLHDARHQTAQANYPGASIELSKACRYSVSRPRCFHAFSLVAGGPGGLRADG